MATFKSVYIVCVCACVCLRACVCACVGVGVHVWCMCVATERNKRKRDRKLDWSHIYTCFHTIVQFAKPHHVFTECTFSVSDIIIITI